MLLGEKNSLLLSCDEKKRNFYVDLICVFAYVFHWSILAA